MQFTAKFVSILAVASIAQASRLAARKTEEQQDEVSVIFFDNTYFRGASYSPDALVQGACSTLPYDWLDRPQSVEIGYGYSCIFFGFEDCAGPGTTLSGLVGSLPSPSLFNSVESFLCFKTMT